MAKMTVRSPLMQLPQSDAVGVEFRILEQALRACAPLKGPLPYSQPQAEGVFRRLTGRSGHPRSLGEELTALAADGCKDTLASCVGCPMQMFCSTGRAAVGRNREAVPFVDLFAGAGGFSLGFEVHGFEPVLALDNDAVAIQTYRFNRPGTESRAIVADLRETSEDRSLRGLGPLVIGGPPCQSFSNANRQRDEHDIRHQLVDVFLRAVCTVQSRMFVMENVPGVRAHDKMFATFAQRAGYTIFHHVIDAADLGVPQRRKRVFLFGVRTRSAAQRAAIARAFQKLVTTPVPGTLAVLDDAIRDLPRVSVPKNPNSTLADSRAVGFVVARRSTVRGSAYVDSINLGKTSPFLLNHRAKYLNERDQEIYRLLRPGDKSDAGAIAHIMPYGHRAHIFRDKFYRLQGDELSKTITAHMYYDTHMYIHPRQARGLTPRESARIQGFPDNYLFLGRPNQWYRQIGNAVSPPVAAEVARIATALLSVSGEAVPA